MIALNEYNQKSERLYIEVGIGNIMDIFEYTCVNRVYLVIRASIH